MQALYLDCGARSPQLMRDSLGGHDPNEIIGVAQAVTQHAVKSPPLCSPATNDYLSVVPSGPDCQARGAAPSHARAHRDTKGSSLAGREVPRPPNPRLKLTPRIDCGMDLSAARRSLSAIR
jgi:hypothetical protein